MAQIIITSHHTVKPSSPTPLASKIHKLSFLDQIALQHYVPLIFFYKNDESTQHEEISRRLKQSLSEVLTIFYPLAGTIRQNSFVDCNDRGAKFLEARVDAHLQQFTQNPKMEELIISQLLPVDGLSHNDDDTILCVKTSFFDCRGFSVGICLSHKIADVASIVAFMNAWGATCRNGKTCRIIHPSFDLALRFPPRDLPPASGFSLGSTKEKIVTKRLVFEKEKVEKLRKEVFIGEIKNPTRVEVVSVFIWRCFIEANKDKTETTSFTASHAVNLRQRVVPQLPDHTFGNCVMLASAVISPEEYDDEDGSLLVSKLRAAIRAVGDHFSNNGIDNISRPVNEAAAGNCIFSSWLRFPVYEVDFSWGKPIWICIPPSPYMNLVIMTDTPSGDGVEAWINVPNDDFYQLLQHKYNNLLP